MWMAQNLWTEEDVPKLCEELKSPGLTMEDKSLKDEEVMRDHRPQFEDSIITLQRDLRKSSK
jgi:hypothetical protein